MAKYRKKPIVVEAFRWTVDAIPQWWRDTKGIEIEVSTCTALIPTREGIMRASPLDYIILEPFPTEDRKIYPCKPDIFEATYEKVEDESSFIDSRTIEEWAEEQKRIQKEFPDDLEDVDLPPDKD